MDSGSMRSGSSSRTAMTRGTVPGPIRGSATYSAWIRQVKPASFTVGEVWDSVETMRAYYPDQLDAYFAFPLADADYRGRALGVEPLAALPTRPGPARLSRRAIWRLPPQPRPDPHDDGAERRRETGAPGRDTAPHHARNSVRVLRRGDRHDRAPSPIPGCGHRCTGIARLPWDSPRDCPGSRCSPIRSRSNVEVQAADPALAAQPLSSPDPASGASLARSGARAEFDPLQTGGDSVLAYIRRGAGSTALVVANPQ